MILSVVQHYTVRSAVGPMTTPLSLELSNFMLDHPDLAAELVRRHKIAPYQVVMNGPMESQVDDGEGTRGLIALVEKKEAGRIYYAEGIHAGGFFPSIRASAAIYMALERQAGPCGPQIQTSFDVYVRLNNPVLSGMVKVLHVFLQKRVIHKFTKAFTAADKIGRMMAENPDEMSEEIRALPSIPPADRTALLNLIARLKQDRPGGPCGAIPFAPGARR